MSDVMERRDKQQQLNKKRGEKKKEKKVRIKSGCSSSGI
jgi:hypothetical protein